MGKKIFCLLLLLSIADFTHGQTGPHRCNQDSLNHSKLLSFMDSIGHGDNDFRMALGLFVYGKFQEDCFCNLVVFAKIFDSILAKGIDLNYEGNIDTSTLWIRMYMEPKPKEVLEEEARKRAKIAKDRQFIDFLEVKAFYERVVIRLYREKDNEALANDVKTIISSGLYRYPKTVTDILMLRYSYLTREKFEKQEMDAMEAYRKRKH